MDIFSLDIASIVDLGTRVAQAGAMRVAEVSPDQVFDYIVAMIAIGDGGAGDGE